MQTQMVSTEHNTELSCGFSNDSVLYDDWTAQTANNPKAEIVHKVPAPSPPDSWDFDSVPVEQVKDITQEEQMLRWLTFNCKITKIMLAMFLKYTQVTQFLLYLILLMFVASMHHLTTVNKI